MIERNSSPGSSTSETESRNPVGGEGFGILSPVKRWNASDVYDLGHVFTLAAVLFLFCLIAWMFGYEQGFDEGFRDRTHQRVKQTIKN